MSNPLNARRVMFQDLDNNGNAIGKTYYGVIVSDLYDSAFNNTFESVEALNAAIEEKGCIAHLCYEYTGADPGKVGTDNFYGYNWEYGDDDELDEEIEEDEEANKDGENNEDPNDGGTHCPHCKHKFSKRSIDGGRCLKCESMIIGLPPKS